MFLLSIRTHLQNTFTNIWTIILSIPFINITKFSFIYTFHLISIILTRIRLYVNIFGVIAISPSFSVHVHACLIASSYPVCHPYLNQLTRFPSLHIITFVTLLAYVSIHTIIHFLFVYTKFDLYKRDIYYQLSHFQSIPLNLSPSIIRILLNT